LRPVVVALVVGLTGVAPVQSSSAASASAQIISTYAGNGTQGFSGDGGLATLAQLSADNVAVDRSGNVFTLGGDRVRRIDAATGVITTVAGNGTEGFSGDGGQATAAQLYGFGLGDVTVDQDGNLFIADTLNHRIRRVDAATKVITTVAGNGRPPSYPGVIGDGAPATAAFLNGPQGVAVDGAGNLFIADTGNSSIRRVDAAEPHLITTVAGSAALGSGFFGDGGRAIAATLSFPKGVDVDGDGYLFIADTGNQRVRRVDATDPMIITTVAGNGSRTDSFSGDGGPAINAALNEPRGVEVGPSGELFIADTGNQRVRRVDLAQTITTVAGDGLFGLSGDGGPANLANLARPSGVGLDGAGNLFIADTDNSRVRKVNAELVSLLAHVAADFDGDTVSDIAVYRPNGNSWFVQGGLSTQWGAPDDVAVPGDYTGDGKTDVAVFRPSDQTWYVQGGLATQWGKPGDVPVPADYNGDGKTDVAVFRPSDQTWYVQGGLATQWGFFGDVPVPADYNGDGKADVAVYRPSDQTWYSQGTGGIAAQWGTSNDVAVPADYNGDGRAEVAVFRPADQTWYSQGTGGIETLWGAPGDIPVVVPAHLRSIYGL